MGYTCMRTKSIQLCLTLQPYELKPTRLLCPWDFPGQNTEHMRRKELGTPWWPAAAAAAKSLQSCPTLCDPIDSSPPSSPIPGILQARTLE